MNRNIKKVISFILIISLVVSLCSACDPEPKVTPIPTLSPTSTPSPTPYKGGEDNHNVTPAPTLLLPTSTPSPTPYKEFETTSINLKDYIEDVEIFVYWLLNNELKLTFDVFPACVILSNGMTVFGLGYTDYEDVYRNEDDELCYYSAGFVSSVGEMSISEEEIEEGLIIQNLDFDYEGVKFLYSYKGNDLKRHCVVYGNYVEYGILDGQIYFTATPFKEDEKDKIDFKSLGSLYSYDTGEASLLYEAGDGLYVLPEGVSVPTIDYDAIEKEIKEVMASQDANEIEYRVDSYVTIAQGAITNYILELQQETFMGYDVDYLLEEIKKVEANECIRITPEGLEIVDAFENGSALARFLVGTASVVAVAVGIIGTAICAELPALSAAAGAVIAFAVNMFAQIVVEKKSLTELDWKSIVIGTIAGAVSGFVGPYITAATGGVVGFFLDSSLDGIIGGIEQVVENHLNGDTGKSDIETFGYGFCLGFTFSAAIKGAAKGLGTIISKSGKGLYNVFPKSVQKNLDKLKDSLKNKIINSKFVKKLANIKNYLEKNSGLRSDYIAKKTANKLEKIYNIEKLQNECIKNAEKTPDLDSLKSLEKGNYAEMKVDRDLAEKGYKRISKECVTDFTTPTGPGIDGVYENIETGKILIIETKFNKSKLAKTLDGKQMSYSWIDKRLDSAVGKEIADNIRVSNPDSVRSVLARVDLNGDISYSLLDSAGNIVERIKL